MYLNVNNHAMIKLVSSNFCRYICSVIFGMYRKWNRSAFGEKTLCNIQNNIGKNCSYYPYSVQQKHTNSPRNNDRQTDRQTEMFI